MLSIVRDGLAHLARLALSITAASITLLYFAFAVDAESVAVADELGALRRTITMIVDAAGDSRALFGLIPRFERHARKHVSKALRGHDMPPPDDETRLSIPAKASIGCEPSEAQTLAELKTTFVGCAWEVTLPTSVVLDRTPRPGLHDLKAAVFSLKRKGDHVDHVGTILASFVQFRRSGPDGMTPYEVHDGYEFRWTPGKQRLERLPDDPFDRLPALRRHWPSLRHRRLVDLLREADPNARSFKEVRDVNVFGLTIASDFVGRFLPLSILVAQAYLLAHASSVLGLLRAVSPRTRGPHRQTIEVRHVSPWIGSMTGGFALALTFLSLSIVPSVAIATGLWRLAGYGFLVTTLSTLLALVLGVIAVANGQEIAHEHVSLDAR